MSNKTKILLPFVIITSICLGAVLGIFLMKKAVYSGYATRYIYNNKMDMLLDIVSRKYVDSLNIKDLTEEAAAQLLADLDPHSAYISADDVETVNSELESSFGGIGVQFNIQNDTVMIVSVISGGPSEKLGILPGDRIIKVNDSLFIGNKMTNDKVVKTLRGRKGTSVQMEIKRNSSKELLHYEIVRGEIPVNSVDIFYLIEPKVGYIKISKFAEKTYEEFMSAIETLKEQKATSFIIDLRGNSGGYLEAATAMIDEFLEQDRMIVYTEGKAYPRENYFASGDGSCIGDKVVVLIDEWSASASEIFAGAIQDNDRGTIVGRRSFGKGLVQTQIPFPDKSAIRLTIARYYTPSGRCIQKPYQRGAGAEYEQEVFNRYLNGELDNKDSLKTTVDTTTYRTLNGRIVHGGGGIEPDVFVPRDTTAHTVYYNKLMNRGYLYQFAFEYADRHRQTLGRLRNWQSIENYLLKNEVAEEFFDYAEEKGLRRNPHSVRKSKPLIQNQLIAYISRNILGENGFYPVLNRTDSTVKKALEVIKKRNR